jgi:pyrroloquinoline quinone (PQQ) biosynthesis protein C
MSSDLDARLLAVMDRKDHWAWPWFTRPGLTKDQLAVHFRHEFHTYVRDFPVLLARVLGQGPPEDVRVALAQNIAEEQTGHLSFGMSHPELFLRMMEGVGLARARMTSLDPLLDRVSAAPPWIVGAAVLTIFVEGSVHERAEREGRRELLPVEEAIRQHPLVKFHGCPPDAMQLVRAHRAVEGGHREDAWTMVLRHAPADRASQDAIVEAVEASLAAWLAYRDGVARAMGLARP